MIGLLLLTNTAIWGCSNSESTYDTTNKRSRNVQSLGEANAFSGFQSKVDSDSTAPHPQEKSQAADAVDKRKIIYEAKLQLVVDDFANVPATVTSLVNRHDGFIAQSDVGSMQGRSRSGSWKIRIPVEKYQDFLNASGEVGQTESLSQNAADVSEQFYDAQARVSNKKRLETRIVKLLEKSDQEIQHVIEVENALGRVREEIEIIEGRLRYLADRTSLATVELNIREQRNYVPETAASLNDRIATAWTGSVFRLQRSAENFIILIVANFFNLVFFVFTAVVIYIFYRRWLGRMRKLKR